MPFDGVVRGELTDEGSRHLLRRAKKTSALLIRALRSSLCFDSRQNYASIGHSPPGSRTCRAWDCYLSRNPKASG